MSAIPTKGIHVQTTMKWLFRKLIAGDELAASYPRPDMYPANNPTHFGGGSENMKLLYCAVGYIANLSMGRERLINWYANEQGHGGGEPLTVSHCQLHLGGHSAIALHAYQSKDDEILSLALNWLAIEYHLLSLCEVDGEPWTPGARGISKDKVIGENPTRGNWLRAVRGGKSPKLNQYDLGACCTARLPVEIREQITTGSADMSIVIQGDLSITRAGNTFAAIFNSLPIGGGGVQAAGYDGIDRWIYRDANTPEIAVKVGKLSKAGNRIHEQFKSPSIPKEKRKMPMDSAANIAMVNSPVPKIPTTCADLMSIAELPYSQAVSPISQADSELVKKCFSKIYPNFGTTYMHASDHKAALVIILGREPTFREVQDSAHLSGSRNIDAARIKAGTGADNRPTGWDDWNDDSKRLAVLVHLYGISAGSRIADGKRKDPDPAKTQALMVLWGLNTQPEPGKPIDPEIKPEPKPSLLGEMSIEIAITTETGQVRRFKGVEIK